MREEESEDRTCSDFYARFSIPDFLNIFKGIDDEAILETLEDATNDLDVDDGNEIQESLEGEFFRAWKNKYPGDNVAFATGQSRPEIAANAAVIRRAKVTARRRRPLLNTELTEKQAEAVHIVGECQGNIAKAARKLGRDRKTVEELYDKAMAKMGKMAVKHTTGHMPTDRRGQESVADGEDRRGI